MPLLDYMRLGGDLMWVIFAMSVVACALLLWRLFAIMAARRGLAVEALALADDLAPLRDGRAGEGLLLAALERRVESSHDRLGAGLRTVRLIGSSAPLVGLLGTVIGIFQAFDAVARQGLGDPRIFAHGLYVALLTTVAGLLVAIPCNFAHNILVGLLDGYVLELHRSAVERLLRRAP